MDTFFKYTAPKLVVGFLLFCVCAAWSAVDAWHSVVYIRTPPGDPEVTVPMIVDHSRFARAQVLGVVAFAALVYVFILVRNWRLSRKAREARLFLM